MKILQILKADLRDVRDGWAKEYRRMRRENPAKARLLFRRMRAAMDLTEVALQENVMRQFGEPK